MTSILISFFIVQTNLYFENLNKKRVEKRKNIENSIKYQKKSGFWILLPFTINGNEEWETTADEENWCNGQGTWADPYIIENVTIDGGSTDGVSCIDIKNSNISFIIRNCKVYNSGSEVFDAGIRLDNVNNSLLIKNNCSFNNGNGILIKNCNNNTFLGNSAYNNSQHGINLEMSGNNTFSESIIKNNTQYGFYLQDTDCENNFFYKNYFINNKIHAFDDGTNNKWNSSVIGNFWDNYTDTVPKPVDNDADGIGNTPYNLSRSPLIQDELPIYGDPFHNGSNIHIDDNNISSHGWRWVSTRAWCSGSGTELDPYIIKDLEINGKNKSSCVLIGNSSAYFTIRNCRFYNSSNGNYSAGIKLDNVNNSLLINNNCSFNNRHGIRSNYCYNNTIWGNTIYKNSGYGIYFYYGNNNTISENTVNNNEVNGIYLENINYTKISENTVNDNQGCGIFLNISHNITVLGNIANFNLWNGIVLYINNNNTIFGNNASSNGYNGIVLDRCNDTTILRNTANKNNYIAGIGLLKSNNSIISENFFNNNIHGIHIANNSNYNDIMGNMVHDNSDCGIAIMTYSIVCNHNIIFNNSLIGNGIQAYDECINNYWNNTLMGNYWGDYEGKDVNDDGIGDIPHSIEGSAENFDYKPIWWDVLVLSVSQPDANALFGRKAPTFLISIDEGVKNTTWYTLNKGLTKISFTGTTTLKEITGTIAQTSWNSLNNGTVSIRFYANDSRGYVNFAEIIVRIDVLAPIIMVNLPLTNAIFNNTSPNYSLSITEANIDTIWYNINGNNYTLMGLTGKINQTLWDALGEGIINITFFANDTMGNVGFQKVSVVKRIISNDFIEFLLSPTGLLITGLLIVILGIVVTGVIIKKKKTRIEVTEEGTEVTEEGTEAPIQSGKKDILYTPADIYSSQYVIKAEEVEEMLSPQELEKLQKSQSEIDLEKSEFICVVHKGPIDGPIYLCPNCHTLYCVKCANALKETGEKCWSCDQEFQL